MANGERPEGGDGRPDPLTVAMRAVEDFRQSAADARAIGDRLAAALYRFETQEELCHWLVPPNQRPSCPLDGKPCTSWTCLVDVCVDAKKEV